MAIDTQALRTELEDKLRELQARAETIDNRLRQPGDQDWEEQAVQLENDQVLQSLDEQVLSEITQIKFALARLDEGRYGTCARCGQPIGEARLKALPYATYCIACA